MVGYKATGSVLATGCVKLTFTAGVPTLDPNTCIRSYQSAASTKSATCVIDGMNLKITGFDANSTPNTDVIFFIVRMKGNATPVGITANVYFESSCTTLMETKVTTTTFVQEAALTAPTNVYIKEPLLPLQVAIKSTGLSMLDFQLKLPTTLTAATTTYLQFSTSLTTWATVESTPATYGKVSCFISTAAGAIPSPCTLVTGVIKIYPSTNLTANTQYRVQVTTKGVPTPGLLQGATNQVESIELKTYNSGTQVHYGVYYYTVPDATITKLTVRPWHVSKNAYNIFDVTIDTAVAITDVLVIEFPMKTLDLKQNLFAEDLGTGLSTGGQVACTYVSATDTATLVKGDSSLNVPAKLRITGAVVAAGTPKTFQIIGVFNPNPTDNDQAPVWLRVYVEVGGVSKAERILTNLYIVANPQSPLVSEPSAAWNAAVKAGGTGQLDLSTTATITTGGTIAGCFCKHDDGKTALPNLASGTPSAGTTKVADASNNAFAVELTPAITLNVPALVAIGYKTDVKITCSIFGSISATDTRKVILATKQSTLLVTEQTITAAIETLDWTADINNNFMFVKLKFNNEVIIPSGNFIAVYLTDGTKGTFASADASYLQSISLPIAPKYKWNSGAGCFVITVTSDLTATTDFIVQVYVKMTTSVKFTAEVYADEALTATKLVATGTSAAVTETAGLTTPASISLVLNAAPSFKANTGITAFSFNLVLSSAITTTSLKVFT